MYVFLYRNCACFQNVCCPFSAAAFYMVCSIRVHHPWSEKRNKNRTSLLQGKLSLRFDSPFLRKYDKENVRLHRNSVLHCNMKVYVNRAGRNSWAQSASAFHVPQGILAEIKSNLSPTQWHSAQKCHSERLVITKFQQIQIYLCLSIWNLYRFQMYFSEICTPLWGREKRKCFEVKCPMQTSVGYSSCSVTCQQDMWHSESEAVTDNMTS